MPVRHANDNTGGWDSSADDHDPPPQPPGRLVKVLPRPVIVAAAIAFPLALITLLTLAIWTLLVGTAPLVDPVGHLFAVVEQSNVDAHVPERKDFECLLTRDLEAYFAEQTGQAVTVTYELLRDVPSQAGTAYPKFYAWVEVFDGFDRVGSGVVRVGAVDKASFYVTHFFTVDDIRQDPARIKRMFGDDSWEKIEKKMSAEN